MRTFDFASELKKAVKEGSTGEIDRWLESFRDLQAQYTGSLVFLARYIDTIPTELKEKYVEALLDALESASDDIQIKTSGTLKNRLMALTDSQTQPSLKKRLRAALEQHTIES
jgi:hypothetical protein